MDALPADCSVLCQAPAESRLPIQDLATSRGNSSEHMTYRLKGSPAHPHQAPDFPRMPPSLTCHRAPLHRPKARFTKLYRTLGAAATVKRQKISICGVLGSADAAPQHNSMSELWTVVCMSCSDRRTLPDIHPLPPEPSFVLTSQSMPQPSAQICQLRFT